MTAQRHRIRRQILEVTVPGGDRSVAWKLQADLARIQKSAIEELLDRCLSEVGSPDRLHRIDSLELNLGELNLANIDVELVKKLGPALRESLSERIRADDERAVGRGGDPESSARLELLALFLQSGNLPWWADSSRPRLVDEAVAFLLERAVRPLTGLLQSLLADERERRQSGRLLRLVLACTDARLEALFGALLSSAQPALTAHLGPPERAQTLRLLLSAQPAIAGVTATQFRTAVWMGALRAAGSKEAISDGPIGLWRLTLAQLALAANVSYAALLKDWGRQLEPLPAVPLHLIVRTLSSELPGAIASNAPAQSANAAEHPKAQAQDLAELRMLFEAALATATALPAPAPPISDDPNELSALLTRLEKLPGSPSSTLAELLATVRAALPHLSPAQRRALLAPLHILAQHAQTGTLDETLRATASAISAHMQVTHPQPHADPDAVADPDFGELLAILTRLKQLPSLLPGLFSELFVQLQTALRPSSATQLPRLPSLLEPLRALEAQAQTNSLGTAETLPALRRLLAVVASERWLPAATLARSFALIQQAQTEANLREATPRQLAKDPVGDFGPPPQTDVDVSYGDADEVYVENAGLVLLWPFFIHLFERLELMTDKKFKDSAALHRAVGLLQHLVTGETEPAEYQLTLAKILCGMELSEVWNFGSPLAVTAAESEECENLLTAAILNAPVLGEMSIAGFRTSLLMRKGALSARDGAWLLRVERLEYDLVLERLPWTLSWIKLPWTDIPLAVEW